MSFFPKIEWLKPTSTGRLPGCGFAGLVTLGLLQSAGRVLTVVILRLSLGSTCCQAHPCSCWQPQKIHFQAQSCGSWQASGPGWLLATRICFLPSGSVFRAAYNLTLLSARKREGGARWKTALHCHWITVVTVPLARHVVYLLDKSISKSSSFCSHIWYSDVSRILAVACKKSNGGTYTCLRNLITISSPS